MPSIPQILTTTALVAVSSGMAVPSLTVDAISQAKCALQAPFCGLTACDSRDTDPTWAVGSSAYQDGEGVNIGNICDNGQGGKAHCWTDYLPVDTSSAMQPRAQVMGNIECPAKADGNCAQTLENTNEQCFSFVWTVTEKTGADFEFEIAKNGIEVPTPRAAQSRAAIAALRREVVRGLKVAATPFGPLSATTTCTVTSAALARA